MKDNGDVEFESDQYDCLHNIDERQWWCGIW